MSIPILILVVAFMVQAQTTENENSDPNTEKAETVIGKAIARLGGSRYLDIRTSVGKGRFSLLREGKIISFQSFTDVIVHPDKERTDFIESGSKTVQVNTGGKGWLYEEHVDRFVDQGPQQIANFVRSLRTHYDFLLRGRWKGKAKLSYAGRRQASLGVRNDVVRLDFEGGFFVEYEFADDGTPMKTVYTRINDENRVFNEENRFNQFILTQGVLAPFIVDHFTNRNHIYRANYESIRFNRSIPAEIFQKPANTKKLRKKLKL